MRLLNNNDVLYNKSLEHKIQQKVKNDELLKHLKQRKYETNSIVEDFECFVCQRSVDGETTMAAMTVDAEARKSEDMCGIEPIFPKMSTKIEHSKASLLKQGQCEADLLRDMILTNQPFTLKQMQDELIAKYNTGACKL